MRRCVDDAQEVDKYRMMQASPDSSVRSVQCAYTYWIIMYSIYRFMQMRAKMFTRFSAVDLECMLLDTLDIMILIDHLIWPVEKNRARTCTYQ